MWSFCALNEAHNLWSDTILDVVLIHHSGNWSCLMLVFCEVIYENVKAWPECHSNTNTGAWLINA